MTVRSKRLRKSTLIVRADVVLYFFEVLARKQLSHVGEFFDEGCHGALTQVLQEALDFAHNFLEEESPQQTQLLLLDLHHKPARKTIGKLSQKQGEDGLSIQILLPLKNHFLRFFEELRDEDVLVVKLFVQSVVQLEIDVSKRLGQVVESFNGGTVLLERVFVDIRVDYLLDLDFEQLFEVVLLFDDSVECVVEHDFVKTQSQQVVVCVE